MSVFIRDGKILGTDSTWTNGRKLIKKLMTTIWEIAIPNVDLVGLYSYPKSKLLHLKDTDERLGVSILVKAKRAVFRTAILKGLYGVQTNQYIFNWMCEKETHESVMRCFCDFLNSSIRTYSTKIAQKVVTDIILKRIGLSDAVKKLWANGYMEMHFPNRSDAMPQKICPERPMRELHLSKEVPYLDLIVKFVQCYGNDIYPILEKYINDNVTCKMERDQVWDLKYTTQEELEVNTKTLATWFETNIHIDTLYTVLSVMRALASSVTSRVYNEITTHKWLVNIIV